MTWLSLQACLPAQSTSSTLAELKTRPDFAVAVSQALVVFIEVKATIAAPDDYRSPTRPGARTASRPDGVRLWRLVLRDRQRRA